MKQDIFEIFRTFSRYLEKNSRYLEKSRKFPETYLGLVLTGLCPVDSTCSLEESKEFCSAY